MEGGVAENSGGAFGEAKESLYAGNGEPGGSRTRFNGFVGLCEIVPGEGIDVGANDQVGVALPGVELMLLRGADCARNHLEHILGCVAATVVHADRDTYDDGPAELTSGLARTARSQNPIAESPRPELIP